MDAGRFLLYDAHPELSKRTLVITSSVSGRVTRTVEAMRLASHKGALCVAITGHPQAPLAKAASRIIDCTIPALPNPDNVVIPGVRSYRMTLIVQFLLAIYIAETLGTISDHDAASLREQLVLTADAIEDTLADGEKQVRSLVKSLFDEDYFLFVGHGPHRATAEFSAAKVIEAAGLIAYGQDTEEWAHIQHYENVRPAMPTFLFCSGHRGHDHVLHLIPHIKNTGRTIIGVLSERCSTDHTALDHLLTIKGDTPEFFTPLVYPVLPELFSALIAEKLGVAFFRKDVDNYKVEDLARIRGENTITPDRLKELTGV